MGKEDSANEWRTFPEYPDEIELDFTVYEVIQEYELYRPKVGNPQCGKWTYENYADLCLWDWDNHRFVDVYGAEYYYEISEDPAYRNHKLFWRVADLPPGLKNLADRIYTELCRQHIRPFYDEREDMDFYEARERYEDRHADDKWKELHGE